MPPSRRNLHPVSTLLGLKVPIDRLVDMASLHHDLGAGAADSLLEASPRHGACGICENVLPATEESRCYPCACESAGCVIQRAGPLLSSPGRPQIS